MDECDLGKDLCNGNAFCTNNIGLYECSCMDGYKGDGYDCRGTCKFSFIFVFSLSQILTIFLSTEATTSEKGNAGCLEGSTDRICKGGCPRNIYTYERFEM